MTWLKVFHAKGCGKENEIEKRKKKGRWFSTNNNNNKKKMQTKILSGKDALTISPILGKKLHWSKAEVPIFLSKGPSFDNVTPFFP